jgi:hypothetical protein
MTTGNVFFTQTFRHLEEVSALGGEDLVFQKIKASEAGRKMLYDAFKTHDVKSFAHMMTFGHSQRKSFFQSLVRNIDQFTSGQNSDLMYVPSLKTSHGDLGIGVQAFLDSDGDHTLHFMVDGPAANRIAKQVRTNGDLYAVQDFNLRGFFNALSGQSKGALASLATKSNLPKDVMAKVTQDVLKEVGTSMETGNLDVALRPLHEAFLAYEQDPLQKAYARMFLGNLQENFVIKGKKLPSYEYLGEQVSSAAKRFTATGNIDELSTLLNRLFEGQAIATERGMTFDGKITMDANVDPAMRAQVEEYLASLKLGGSYSLNDFLSRAKAVVNQGLSEGSLDKTSGQWKAAISEDAFHTLQSLRAGKVFGSAMLEGYGEPSLGAKTEVAVDAMRRNFSRIDSHMTGKLALGALASAGLFGMMGGGADPEPIIMPGETPSSGVLGAVASGSLFSRRDPEISPEQIIAPDNQYDRMNPINMGAAYATRPNSYQIRGEVSSGMGLTSFGSYFNQLTGGNGRGVITINDQRRPITSNYVDRLLGEY